MARRRFRTLPRRLRAELHDSIHLDGVTYQHQFIQCSKPTCDEWHGPYWYAFFKTPVTDKNGRKRKGRTRSKYIGRELPPAVVEGFRQAADDADEVMREARREIRKRH